MLDPEQIWNPALLTSCPPSVRPASPATHPPMGAPGNHGTLAGVSLVGKSDARLKRHEPDLRMEERGCDVSRVG